MTDHTILSAEAHRDLRIRTDVSQDLGDGVMACLTFPDEFRRVQSHYPILFRHNNESDTFSAMAMFGLEEGENLFLRDDRWDAPYKPLALAIQPFLIGAPPPGQAGEKKVHIDMASPRISHDDADGTRVFDEDGQATPFLEQIAEMLGELDEGYRAGFGFFEALQRYELLEPMVLDVPHADGSAHRLVGFHMVDEAKLEALPAEAVAELHSAGYLMPIFMAVASLGHLSQLVTRKTRRDGHG